MSARQIHSSQLPVCNFWLKTSIKKPQSSGQHMKEACVYHPVGPACIPEFELSAFREPREFTYSFLQFPRNYAISIIRHMGTSHNSGSTVRAVGTVHGMPVPPSASKAPN